MFQHDPNNLDPTPSSTPSSNTPEWLSQLRPASASSLQASVFYQAGYEAARHELGKSAWRRANIVAIAASVLMAGVFGALLFQLGKENGLAIAASKQGHKDKHIDAPETNRDWQLASASPNRDVSVEVGASLIPSWFQSQISRMLPISNPRSTFLGPGVELGSGAKLEEIIVLNRPPSRGSLTDDSVANEPTEPQSLRAIRDNRINSLMESLL